jgi:hypothetical protein
MTRALCLDRERQIVATSSRSNVAAAIPLHSNRRARVLLRRMNVYHVSVHQYRTTFVYLRRFMMFSEVLKWGKPELHCPRLPCPERIKNGEHTFTGGR